MNHKLNNDSLHFTIKVNPRMLTYDQPNEKTQ